MTADQLTLGIQQFAPRLRAPAENLARIVDAAAGVDLLLTPELSLTGYDVGDAAHHLALPLETGAPFPLADARTDSAIVLGMITIGFLGLTCSGIIRMVGSLLMPWLAFAPGGKR